MGGIQLTAVLTQQIDHSLGEDRARDRARQGGDTDKDRQGEDRARDSLGNARPAPGAGKFCRWKSLCLFCATLRATLTLLIPVCSTSQGPQLTLTLSLFPLLCFC